MDAKKIFYILLVCCSFLNSCYYLRNKEKSNMVFNELIGTFTLDLNQTNLGRYSDKQYKNLQISFNKDSTFNLNMNVPFLYDSVGKWLPTKGGLEDWNWIFYKNNPRICTQFSEVWTEDSMFYFNSATPKKGQEAISKIYFRKIKR